MIFTVISTTIALLTYLVIGTMVSQARGKYGIKAPATTGSPEFERMFRVHQNMLEQIVVFLPVLWMFAVNVSDLYAGLLGLVWTVGRIIYAASYFKDASKRSAGFVISLLATLILMAGAVIGVIFHAL